MTDIDLPQLCGTFLEEYGIVFASSAFIFANTSSDQIFLVSREHFRKYGWQAASTS